jgi:hypothetical protein
MSKSELDPTFIGPELFESMNVHEEGWYLVDDNFKAAAGPFASKKAAEDYAKRC